MLDSLTMSCGAYSVSLLAVRTSQPDQRYVALKYSIGYCDKQSMHPLLKEALLQEEGMMDPYAHP